MKLIAAASVGLVAAGQANVELARARRQIAGFERAVASNGAVITATNFGMDEEGYGCWCYFGEDHKLKLAKGIPLDEYDQACHDLSRAYECAIIDSDQDEFEGTCTPWLVDYEVVDISPGNDYHTLCEAANPQADGAASDEDKTLAFCRMRACMIESLFTERLRDLALTQNIDLNQFLQHTHANWEPTREIRCTGVNKNQGGTNHCCGNYPNRYPRNTFNGNVACCYKHPGTPVGINFLGNDNGYGLHEVGLFNVRSHQCCVDGSGAEIQVFGEVCGGSLNGK